MIGETLDDGRAEGAGGKKAAAPVAPLMVGPREAAAMLGVSPRTLWGLTAGRKVPRVKIGARVLYRVADLERFAASLSTR